MNIDYEYVQYLKDRYPKGTVIVLTSMGDDPRPIPAGTRGTVRLVDDMGTVHCDFENGRRLGLIPGEDSFSILPAKEKDLFLLRNEDLDRDVFFFNKDAETVYEIYYNPDSAAGGQFVQNSISFDLIRGAHEEANGNTEMFFDILQEEARQYLTDIGDDDFGSMLEWYKSPPDAVGYCADTMETLMKLTEPEKVKIRPMKDNEYFYCYTQSQQIMGQTGCIGHLRGDMDTSGTGFFTSWDDHFSRHKTQEFKVEFDDIINGFRDDFLKSRSDIAKYCYVHPESKLTDGVGNQYGFRADTENYTYMLRLNPDKGEYNLYCYCYVKEYLNQHLENAARGIRFIDPHYNEQFRIPDGGTISICTPTGALEERTCRYIDNYHVEVGRSLFHICEFAELMEKNGNTVMPTCDTLPSPKKKNDLER